MTINNRPMGITIIAFLTGLFAVISICGNLAGLTFAPFQLFGHGGLGGAVGQAFGAIFALVLAAISLFIAWGLWNLQPWAFWALVITMILQLVNGGLFMRSWFCGTGLIPLLVLAYLFLDRNVRSAFHV